MTKVSNSTWCIHIYSKSTPLPSPPPTIDSLVLTYTLLPMPLVFTYSRDVYRHNLKHARAGTCTTAWNLTWGLILVWVVHRLTQYVAIAYLQLRLLLYCSAEKYSMYSTCAVRYFHCSSSLSTAVSMQLIVHVADFNYCLQRREMHEGFRANAFIQQQKSGV